MLLSLLNTWYFMKMKTLVYYKKYPKLGQKLKKKREGFLRANFLNI